jgi:hypothetical protein
MERISIGLAKAGIDKAIETARSFLSKLLGPALEEAGLVLQDKVRLYRLKNQLRILGKAQDMLREAGLEPKTGPLRTLLPLSEGASLEDENHSRPSGLPCLRMLLRGTVPEGSHPSFPKILGEMSPQEAPMLDRMTDQGGETPWESFRQDMADKLSLSHDEINQKYWNLFRLGLCNISKRKESTAPVIRITPFGQYFVRACSSPS